MCAACGVSVPQEWKVTPENSQGRVDLRGRVRRDSAGEGDRRADDHRGGRGAAQRDGADLEAVSGGRAAVPSREQRAADDRNEMSPHDDL